MKFEIDYSSLENAILNFDKIIVDGKASSSKSFPFQSFKAKNNESKLAVIDGSHHNLSGSNLVFSTIRAGYQIYKNNIKIEEKIDPIIIELITKSNDETNGYIAKHNSYFEKVTGSKPKGIMEFDKVTERIRTILEWEKVKSLLESLSDGDIIMFDGSLLSGVISTSKAFYDSLVSTAKEKGISLVGLSKDTSLSLESAPVPFVLLESSKNYYSNKNWYVPYEDTYFIKFRKNNELIFRLDAVIPNNTTIDEIIKKIAAYCFAAGMEGFPYPMQTIHDAVRIEEMQRDQCFSLFRDKCLSSNISRTYFEQLFSIYHKQLDVLSYGR